MLKAIIKENKIYCPKEHHDYKISDYKTVEIKGQKYTKFIARCKECNEKFYFFSRITVDFEIHFVFNEDDEKEVDEE